MHRNASVSPADTRRARIGVATDPFLLRTGLHQFLSRDPRLEAVLLSPGDGRHVSLPEPHDLDAVIVSEAVEVPNTLVVAYSQTGNTVEVSRHGKTRTFPYMGINSLVELLLAEIRASIRP